MTPFFMCVRTKITELKRRAPDHSAGVQAVRNACKSELIAYSKWLDDQGYNRWSKGFELTALQRTIDKIIADAGNSAPADPAHRPRIDKPAQAVKNATKNHFRN